VTTYGSGAAFRRALQDRLLARSVREEIPLVRLRKLVAFERLLARLVHVHHGKWLLKGGLALQLRFGAQSRTTKDIDILLLAPSELAHSMLVEAARLDLGDWFEFTVRASGRLMPGAGPGALRFHVTALLDGRTFESYHLDAGTGDPVVDTAESLVAPDLLAFAGIVPAEIPCYPLSQQLAEKLHAFVRPRARATRTRVKDLVDMLLIAERATVDAQSLREAVQATFAAFDERVPSGLPDPPSAWSIPFRRLAVDLGLISEEMADAVPIVRRLLDPVLRGDARGTWDPDAQDWR